MRARLPLFFVVLTISACEGALLGGSGTERDGGRGPDTSDAATRGDDAEVREDVDAATYPIDAGREDERDAARPDDDAGTDRDAGSDAGMPPGGGTLSDILTRDAWDAMFPNRNALYTYDALIAAAAFHPSFASEGSLETRRREVAAFLANIGHETTGGWDTAPGGRYAWGLYFIQEVGCESGGCTGYCDPSSARFPCVAGRTYHGRGPIQLSWNYNYGAIGEALGLDLLAHPDLVTSDGTIAFRTAIWFWTTPQSPKPSCHDVMIGSWAPSAEDLAANRLAGFGMTVNVINGGLECGRPGDYRVADRIGFYERFAGMLGVGVGENVDCGAMRPY